MKTLEQLENTLARLLQWIDSADAKTAPVLAITTAMLGIMIAVAPPPDAFTVCLACHGIATITLLLAALIALFFVTFPRTEGPENSLIYFGGIASMSKHEFIDAATQRDESSYATDLAEQCHRNAEIARAKFTSLRISMCLIFLAIVPWLTLLWRLYRIRK